MTTFRAKIRRLESPQTTTTGKVRKNINGDPIYTEYLDMFKSEELQLRMHMKENIDTVIKAKALLSESDFSQALGFSTKDKHQMDNEPFPYSWDRRLEFVTERLKDSNKNLTSGIIDMYNRVVGVFYIALQYDRYKLSNVMIKIEKI